MLDIIVTHALKQARLLRNDIDPVQVIVDLIVEQLLEDSWPSDLRPYQIQQFWARATPSIVCVDVLGAEPTSTLNN